MVPKTLLRLGLFGLLCYTSCTSDTSREVLRASSEEIDTTLDRTQLDTARGVKILLSKQGHLYTSIETELMVRRLLNDRPDEIDMYGGVQIYSISQSQDTSSTVYSKNGFYDERSQYIVLRDSVHIHTSKNEDIQTEYLTWADSTHEFYTQEDIKIITTQQEIQGTGMTAAEDFSYYTIHQIKGIIRVNDAEF